MTPMGVPAAAEVLKQKELLTYEQLLNSSDETNHPEERWEGALVKAPSPDAFHQDVTLSLAMRLRTFVQVNDSGKVYISPLDMVLSPYQVVQPDILFVARERLSLIKRVLHGPADMVVEIISPESRRRDRIDKRDLYSQYGVKEYWIVDPLARTIEILVFDQLQLRLDQRAVAGQQVYSRLLTGFSIGVDDVFNS
jgi:Uma2 family endonuclease